MLFSTGTAVSEELGPSTYYGKARFCLMAKMQLTFSLKESSDLVYLGEGLEHPPSLQY